MNPPGNAESGTKVPERFDWKNTVLTQVEKRAAEDILVECQDFFARRRKDIGINTEFKV